MTGASEYEWNIGNCNTTMMDFDDLLGRARQHGWPHEPGHGRPHRTRSVGYWDTYNEQGRLIDASEPARRSDSALRPYLLRLGKRNGRNADLKVVNYMGFFIERMQGGNVLGRITPISGILSTAAAVQLRPVHFR